MRERQTDPAGMARLLGRLKSHLRITSDDLDGELAGKMLASVEACEHRIGRIILRSTFTETLHLTPIVSLPRPLLSVDGVKVDGIPVEVASCEVDLLDGTLTLPEGTEGETVTVTCESGMIQIPADITHAILLFASSLFSNPMDTVENLPRASARLLRPYRNYGE